MKNWKNSSIAVFTIGCILINLIGKGVAEFIELPLWLDSVGTVLAAYAGGPVCGAIVGAGVNVMYGAFSVNSYVYMITNITVAVIVGICAKKGMFKKAFSAFSVSMMVAFFSTLVSVPLNYFFYDGMTGNLWGDGVIHYLQELGVRDALCYISGEFYVDLVDKIMSVFIVYFIVNENKNRISENVQKYLSSIIVVALITSLASPVVFARDNNRYDEMDKKIVSGVNYYDSYIQTVFNNTNGIPGGEVNDIAQTRDGMLWIGTYGGLYQYDGTNFTFMSSFDSVRNVNCLYTDEEGRLLIGTNDGGLSICSNNEIVNIINKEGGLPEDSVRSIVKGSNGMYYVGTSGALCIIALADGMKVQKIVKELNYVKSIDANENGYVCAVSLNGDLALMKELEIKEMLNEKSDNSEKGFVSVCCADNNYVYVATTENNIEKYVIENDKFVYVSKIKCDNLIGINSMNVINRNHVFVCTDNGIGYIDSDEKFNVINTGNFDSSIDNMLVDYQGNIWFASSRLGLLELSESVFEEVYSKISGEEEVVNATIKWNDLFYFGTDSGLEIANLNGGKSIENDITNKLDGTRIRCFIVDRENSLWISTSGKGVYKVNEKGDVFEFNSASGLIGDKTRALLELENGCVAVATDNGISFIENDEVIFNVTEKEGMVNPKTLCMIEYDGAIYAGTDGGGITKIENGKVVKNIRKAEGLSSDVVMRLVKVSGGEGLHIVTSNGINYMDNNGIFREIKEFPYYNNYDIIASEGGNVWVTSSAGIYIVDEKALISGNEFEYELLDSKKGLRHGFTANSWNYVDQRNNLYLCCDTGVIVINMNKYDNQRTSYRITLENIIVDGSIIYVDKEETNVIQRDAVKIEFAPKVINFSTSNPYVAVWLEGFDEEPNVYFQRELENVVYTNLPSGNYTFHLAILDNKKEAIVEQVSYTFVKEKEIYDNWWFSLYMMVVLAIISVYLIWLIIGSQIDKSLKIQKKEFENLKLKQTADAAVAAGEAKDKFLALMSHDIRTPINAIIGMNEMVLRDSKEQQIYEYALDIKNASNTLLSLVNMILDYSKIEEGKMEIVPVRYETRGVFDNIINGVMSRAKEKNLEFRIKIDETLPREMFGDDVRITQVISNLLTNAVKYTEKGYISFVAKELNREGENIKIYVEVKDSGIGIRKEDMGKLFESFKRLDEERNRNIEGTGLGMSIVSNLLQLMNSELEVESEYGVGTRFSFVLEQKIVSEDAIGDILKSSKTTREKVKEEHFKAPGAKILVVDDNHMNLKVAKGLMKVNDIIPDIVDSGVKAIEQLKNKQYDIVFLDHMMPEMDGIETFKLIRKEKLVPDSTKIIILTANAINGAREQYISIGFDDYLSKPIEISALESKIKKYLPKEAYLDNENGKHEKEVQKLPNDNIVQELTKDNNKQEASLKEKTSFEFTKETIKMKCPEIDMETAMKFCMDSMEFYKEVLEEYIADNKCDEIKKTFEEKKWQDFRVLVHAVKSVSMSIGAVELSEHAKALEFAAKDNDISFIENNFEEFIEMYSDFLEKLKELIDQ